MTISHQKYTQIGSLMTLTRVLHPNTAKTVPMNVNVNVNVNANVDEKFDEDADADADEFNTVEKVAKKKSTIKT
jgi:hypothetical protein